MIRRPPRSTLSSSSAASDVYKRQYQRRVRGPTAGNMAEPTESLLGRLVSEPWSTILLGEQLSPLEVSAVSQSSRTSSDAMEEWADEVGLDQAIRLQQARIAAVQAHPALKKVTFGSYEGFLAALRSAPLGHAAVNKRTWVARYLAAMAPRPRRFNDDIERKFDWGYPGGYWCDAVPGSNGEAGRGRDYMRSVGGSPTWMALCVAGSDSSQYNRWEIQNPQVIEKCSLVGIQDISRIEATPGKSGFRPEDFSLWRETRRYWDECRHEQQLL
eukprot:TRINITY_DN1601_c0_g4_i1.p1 TRINITY_DN1601_c0_g4~~TRINITY_DN1601_c0_g4_i1.p1  ORF type:complete len:271 (+),score=36.86 TRINITY_DN1601_c0_g4_i1:72-884(+)